MRRGYVAFVVLTLVGLGLTGCGLFRYEQREPWRVQAEEACLSQKLVQPSAYMSRTSKIDGPGACGMDYPFKVAAFSSGSIGLNQHATLACPIVATIDAWLEEIVKPAALLYFGVPIADLKAGSYSCRPRNNQRGAKYSEHAFGNAMDVMAFQLADGRQITVAKGWRGEPAEQEFLREVFVNACRYFKTVLGPGSDAFHYDHSHTDLARHDPRGERRICKPALKFEPRIEPGSQIVFHNAGNAADLAPIDVEEDGPVGAPVPSRQAPVVSSAPAAPPGPIYSSAPAAPAASVFSSAQTYRPPVASPQPLQPPGRSYPPPAPARPPTILNGHGLY